MNSESNRIVIAGAGLAGCFLALDLVKQGYHVYIFEKNSRDDISSAASKRSYNLTLYGYGLKLLKKAGIWGELKSKVVPLTGSYTYLANASSPRKAKNGKDSPYYAVSRAQLLGMLLKKVEKNKNINVYFESTIVSNNRKNKTVTVRNLKVRTVPYSLLIGCDGINSKVREFILKNTKKTTSQTFSNWVYQQVPISNKKTKELELLPDHAYTWSSKEVVVASFPNIDKSITAMLIYPQGKRPAFKKIVELFPTLKGADKEFEKSKFRPEGRFVTLHSPVWQDSNMVIIGDAAHGFNPFFGQGVSAAMGDGLFLSKNLKANADQNAALIKFEKERKVHMDALGELSKKGFELYKRDSVADQDVIYDQVENKLHALFPKVFRPSIFESISKSPDRTNDYLVERVKQRKLLSKLGVGIAVKFLTQGIKTYEKFSHS